ncbi:MAG: DNA mismatch repair protein MutS [Syntrophomonadaceae bacterium]|nr:DNA mismatch repair protein MutS [Syntrophomonadaceae bacterium]
MSRYTPMMEQYRAIKEQYRDAILFFRLGDFYEMFFEDAEVASRELEIVLTARDGGGDTRVPMCGVPFHSADTYIAKLIEKGYRVAICEQVEDPRDARGLVKREVVKVITPGTVLDEIMLEEGRNNYLVALVENPETVGLAVIDVSTGDFRVTEVTGAEARGWLFSELYRLGPAECLVPAWKSEESAIHEFSSRYQRVVITEVDPAYYDYVRAEQKLKDYFGVDCLADLGLDSYRAAVIAAGVILAFLESTQRVPLQHIKQVKPYSTRDYLVLDVTTRRNLELTRNARDGKREGSLLAVIDCCVTSMGKRLLKAWLEQPLVDVAAINERLDAVGELVEALVLRDRLRQELKGVYDLERLVARLGSGTIQPRELLALKVSLGVLPALCALAAEVNSRYLGEALDVDDMQDVYRLLDSAIHDEAPATAREGGIIKTGYHPEVDELRKLAFAGKEWLLEFEKREKEQTGIKSLKVGFNKVFGYYIEVTRANLDLVPPHYVRKQTLVNAERFITDELKNYEDKILGAREKLYALEYEVFQGIREELARHIPRLQAIAAALARLDVLACLAETAFRFDYVRPVVDEADRIHIRGGRHPVVEKFLTEERFVPNDTHLDNAGQRYAIITGPNMGGKSTYMRQVALIAILAQMGSFVPASEASIGVLDQIFTRVGAADDLAGGQSTFMVEMVEVARILRHATARSLIVLDEIGRGTSTFDGMSIARAVMEHICRHIGAKTLFATHYHELTSLAGEMPGIVNLSVSVKESGNEVVFLKKVLPGRADKSYGLHVASLAGIPPQVIRRAEDVLRQLESERGMAPRLQRKVTQLNLFPEEGAFLDELRALDLDELKPVEALQILYRWQENLAPRKERNAKAK